MTATEFKTIIESDIKVHKYRDSLANLVVLDNSLIDYLLKAMLRIDESYSTLAARTLELALKKDLKIIFPYLDRFCNALKFLKLDGSVRACAKIIELLCIEYFVKCNPLSIENLTHEHLEQCIESCFDWMINDNATAIQAHSMYALYLLGTEFEWIHPELKETINRSLPFGTIGYQNRGRKVIRAIETGTLLKLY